ncbi:hypothetical protein [Kitasatospora sp. NPDC008115]|uniref:hypothetical protein n=1 Tax=Kitasatospora sp. NPDC008115 TaxID=3364022 RepID=UPI0036E49A3D
MTSEDVPRPRRLQLRLTAGGLATVAAGADAWIGFRLQASGMEAPTAALVCLGLLAVPAVVAQAVVLWSADRMVATPPK